MSGIALVRRPAATLADGIVTFVERSPVDLDLAHRQHAAYVHALASAAWTPYEVEPADDLPDSAFVEDPVVVVDDLAILTRIGAVRRRAEAVGCEAAVSALGLRVARIDSPGTLDGGDVLQIGSAIYVGIGGRSNQSGIEQLATLVRDLGRTVQPVRLGEELHLKSAVTALPDGSVVGDASLVDLSAFAAYRSPLEPAGAHVLPLGGDAVLLAASAPRTAEMINSLGFSPVLVDISEFEKLEGCVTCLSVLVDR